MTILRMRFACWITKATNTHLQYVILIAFPLQQWLQESVLILRYTYIACLVPIALSFFFNYFHRISVKSHLYRVKYLKMD